MDNENKMANRNMEELSIEELDEISAGTAAQIAEDSQFLNSLGGYCDRYGSFKSHWLTSVHEEVAAGWAKVGVKAVVTHGCVVDNQYYINGKWVPREAAYEHARKFHETQH